METIKNKWLRLDLQTFAEQESDIESQDNPKDEPKEPENNTDGEPDKAEGKTFTQEDIDRIVKERLDREKRKREEAVQAERDEAERKRLEEQGEYKALADNLQAQLEALKGDALKAKKEALLIKAGYSDEQVGIVAKLLDGESDEELQASLESVKIAVEPKGATKNYADPSASNPKKQEPKKQDLTDVGRAAVKRLRAKGRVR